MHHVLCVAARANITDITVNSFLLQPVFSFRSLTDMAEQQFEYNLAEKVKVDKLISSLQDNNINFNFTDMFNFTVTLFVCLHCRKAIMCAFVCLKYVSGFSHKH